MFASRWDFIILEFWLEKQMAAPIFFLQICCPPEDILLLPNEFEELQQTISASNSTEVVDFESDYNYEVARPPANFDVSEYYDYDIETCPYHCVTYSFCDLKGEVWTSQQISDWPGTICRTIF